MNQCQTDKEKRNVIYSRSAMEEHKSEKKSTPIYEGPDKSKKTYYELKEFLENEIRPQANYQFVMLKIVLSHDIIHKGIIAENLAIFNNKDSSDIEQVKPFLKVPVYDVLENHGFVNSVIHYGKKNYVLNVELNEYQRMTIDSLLQTKINKWNQEHNIPTASENNIQGIDWFENSNILAQASINNWIWSVTPENWEKVKVNKVWGSKAPPKRIENYVHAGDHIVFYVKGTNAFKGIMEVSESWQDDSSNLRWTDEIANQKVIYNSFVKLNEICLGFASLDDLQDLLVFEGKNTDQRNLVLKAVGGGFPSNNCRTIPRGDFLRIKDLLQNTIEEKLEESVEDNETEFVVKECPRCHYRIEGLTDEKTDKLIEEKFGYRQMDPNNPLDRKTQSYCRNCRSILRHSIGEEITEELDDITEIELFGDSYVVDHNSCVKSPKGNLVRILIPRIRINGRRVSLSKMCSIIRDMFLGIEPYEVMRGIEIAEKLKISDDTVTKVKKFLIEFDQIKLDNLGKAILPKHDRIIIKQKPTKRSIGNISEDSMIVFDSKDDRIEIKQFKLESNIIINKDQTLTNDELVTKFGVGNMGGIRYSSKNNIIVLCHTVAKYYQDEIREDLGLIYYSGEGQYGDQQLSGGNLRIVDSENTPMFYFTEVPQESGQKKRGALDNIYKFVGKVTYLRHAIKTENDHDGNPRKVIKFLLELEK